MKRLTEFLKSTLIGGLLVILPSAILLFALIWVFGLIRRMIGPLTRLLMENSPIQGVVADLLVIAVLVVLCFTVGFVVRTRLGKWAYLFLESRLFVKAPGYSLVKETVSQFFGEKKSPFSQVALVQIFGNETLVSGFVTDEHDDGSMTVFVPTGPNPTSGNIYHLPSKYVHRVQVPVEDAMRSIISCGAGSSMLITRHPQALQRADAIDGGSVPEPMKPEEGAHDSP